MPRPRHALRRSPAYLMGNGPVIRRQQITFRATLIDGLFSTTAARTKFGKRAFSDAGPATWNVLPDHIRTVADPVKFRKLLKSHFFSQAFNICWFLWFPRRFNFWPTFAMQCTYGLGSLVMGALYISDWYVWHQPKKPLRQDRARVWKSAQVVNSSLVNDPTIRQPGFNIPQHWSQLNRF